MRLKAVLWAHRIFVACFCASLLAVIAAILFSPIKIFAFNLALSFLALGASFAGVLISEKRGAWIAKEWIKVTGKSLDFFPQDANKFAAHKKIYLLKELEKRKREAECAAKKPQNPDSAAGKKFLSGASDAEMARKRYEEWLALVEDLEKYFSGNKKTSLLARF